MKKRIPKIPRRPAAVGDGERRRIVKTKEGAYYRRERGSVTKAVLNKVLLKNSITTGATSPAAKNIRQKLSPFLAGMYTGRYIAKVSGKLRLGFNETGRINYSRLKNYDLQPYHPMADLLDGGCSITEKDHKIILTVSLYEGIVRQHTKIAEGYYFEAILLSGDPTKARSLKTDSTQSPIYVFDKLTDKKCQLVLQLPDGKTPWMLLFKVGCVEKDKPILHARYCGMVVVETGGV